jgi:hypothetical protein
MRRMTRRAGRGFLMVDLLIAVAIGGAVLISLGLAVGTLQRGERRMADSRADSRRLEESLLTLQAGGNADPALKIERLGEGPEKRVWVRVSLVREVPGGTPVQASLVGLVPANKAPGGAP